MFHIAFFEDGIWRQNAHGFPTLGDAVQAVWPFMAAHRDRVRVEYVAQAAPRWYRSNGRHG